MSQPQNYPLVEEAFQFTAWLSDLVEKLPRSHKFTIGDRLQSKSLDLLDALIEAIYTRERGAILKRANLTIEQLRYLFRLAAELRLIDLRRYEHAAKTLDTIGRGVGGWRKSAHAKETQLSVSSHRELAGVADGGAEGNPGQA